MCTFARTFSTINAQMAELVDALVSNTSGFTSMPVRSRLWVHVNNLHAPVIKLVTGAFL